MNSTKKNNGLLKSASKLPRKLSLKKSNRSNPALDDISNFSSTKLKSRKGTPKKPTTTNNPTSLSRSQYTIDYGSDDQENDYLYDEFPVSEVDVKSLHQQLEYLNDEVLEHLKSSKEKDKQIQMLKDRLYHLEKEKEDEITQRKHLESIIKSLKMRNKELANENMKTKAQLKEFERKLENLSKKTAVVTQSFDKDMPFVGDRRGAEYSEDELNEKKEIEMMVEELNNIQEKIKEISNVVSIEEIIKMAWDDYYKEESEKENHHELLLG